MRKRVEGEICRIWLLNFCFKRNDKCLAWHLLKAPFSYLVLKGFVNATLNYNFCRICFKRNDKCLAWHLLKAPFSYLVLKGFVNATLIYNFCRICFKVFFVLSLLLSVTASRNTTHIMSGSVISVVRAEFSTLSSTVLLRIYKSSLLYSCTRF